ncbi:MAG: ribosomal-processing cysteine protease Prp [Firmicutes bacterium]|jgi:uncharacterized protein YsxB (DUF464 family)|nr:ribosomal-processing cysteine protease Prp [Bacillota bacterium]
MIKIKVRRDGRGNPIGLEIRGHALFAPQGGDIVCAAVSILAQTVVFALKDLVRLDFPAKIKEGYLSVSAPAAMEKKKADKFFLLMETMLLGLREIAFSYPDYVDYTERGG